MEGDANRYRSKHCGIFYFNPHPPCGGWLSFPKLISLHKAFQSTPSVWRVTNSAALSAHTVLHFNPHPPCGGWPANVDLATATNWFQSTPSVWRVTGGIKTALNASKYFNPHPPCGGWLATSVLQPFPNHFNPHPPCGGWRFCNCVCYAFSIYFNPHPPCGGWQTLVPLHNGSLPFQSTPSVWRVTPPF